MFVVGSRVVVVATITGSVGHVPLFGRFEFLSGEIFLGGNIHLGIIQSIDHFPVFIVQVRLRILG